MVLAFSIAVNTTILRWHATKTVGVSDEPSLWKIEIFFEPQLDYICQPYWITGNNLGDFEILKVNEYQPKAT